MAARATRTTSSDTAPTIPYVGEAEARLLTSGESLPAGWRGGVLEAMRMTGGILYVAGGVTGFRYPAFQFDSASRRVWPIVAAINANFGASQGRQAALQWWTTDNLVMSGHAPMDFVGTYAATPIPEMDVPSWAEAWVAERWWRGETHEDWAVLHLVLFNHSMAEACLTHLSQFRMREIVNEAYRDKADFGLLWEHSLVMEVARTVLARPDCPHDLLMDVVTRTSSVETFTPSVHLMREAVLALPALPETIRVAAALAASAPTPLGTP